MFYESRKTFDPLNATRSLCIVFLANHLKCRSIMTYLPMSHQEYIVAGLSIIRTVLIVVKSCYDDKLDKITYISNDRLFKL